MLVGGRAKRKWKLVAFVIRSMTHLAEHEQISTALAAESSKKHRRLNATRTPALSSAPKRTDVEKIERSFLCRELPQILCVKNSGSFFGSLVVRLLFEAFCAKVVRVHLSSPSYRLPRVTLHITAVLITKSLSKSFKEAALFI